MTKKRECGPTHYFACDCREDWFTSVCEAAAKLVEAAEDILDDLPTGNYSGMTNVPAAVQRAIALRTAIDEYRKTTRP